MTAEARQQIVEEPWSLGLDLQLAAKRRCAAETVAQQCEIARTATPRRQARERSREVGHGPQRRTHALAADRVLVEPGNQRQPLLDRASVGQRCGDILAQKPASGGGLAAVDFA